LKVGDRVSFQGRYGRTEKGTVEKIKIKYVLVRTDSGTRWNVPGSHLTPIKTEEAINA
jgi:small-conductance mechanosensitive channel